MKGIDIKTVLVAGLVCTVICLLLREQPLQARSSDANRDLIAVTGEFGNGTSALFVIDTKTRHMAVYKSDNGKSVELIGARRIEHDLKLVSYRDLSQPAFNPLRMEREFREFSEGRAPASTSTTGSEASEDVVPVESAKPPVKATKEEKK